MTSTIWSYMTAGSRIRLRRGILYGSNSADHITHTDDIRSLSKLSRQPIPLFVLLKRSDYNTHSLFRELQYHYWLTPVYANQLYPQKLILVYHHVPDNPWFIKPNAIRIVNY
jgi:hypothetical protein